MKIRLLPALVSGFLLLHGSAVVAARAVDRAAVRPAVGAVSFAGAIPNPSRGGTMLEYALPKASRVSLRLYSAAGRLVSTIEQGARVAGPHAVPLAGRGMSPGTYFAVLAVDGRRLTRTVILQ